jgi:hypothetical protein
MTSQAKTGPPWVSLLIPVVLVFVVLIGLGTWPIENLPHRRSPCRRPLPPQLDQQRNE